MPTLTKNPDHIVIHNQHVLACPRLHNAAPIPADMLQQLNREIAIGVYLDDAWPKISLPLSVDGNPYPDSSGYHHRLLGALMAQVNYYLEGFIHGGLLKASHWMKEGEANALFADYDNLLDVKAFYKTNFPDVAYQSLSERLFRGNLMRKPDEIPSMEEDRFAVKFTLIRPSFTLEFKQDEMVFDEHVIRMAPEFDITYQLNLPPDYAEYLKDYEQKNGVNPRDYVQLSNCYFDLMESILADFPKLCPDLFHQLTVAQGIASYYKALKAANKMPSFTETIIQSSVLPRYFPPFMAPQFASVDLGVTGLALGQIIVELLKGEYCNHVKTLLEGGISYPDELKEDVNRIIRVLITKLVEDNIKISCGQQFFELDSEKIDEIASMVEGLLGDTSNFVNEKINELVGWINQNNPIEGDILDLDNLDLEDVNDDRLQTIIKYIKQFMIRAEQCDSADSVKAWRTEWKGRFADCFKACKLEINGALSNKKAWKQIGYSYLVVADKAYQDTHETYLIAPAHCKMDDASFRIEKELDNIEQTAAFAKAMLKQPTHQVMDVQYQNEAYDVFQAEVYPCLIVNSEHYQSLFKSLKLSADENRLDDEDIQKIKDFLAGTINTLTLSSALRNADGQTILHYALTLNPSPERFIALEKLYPTLCRIEDRRGNLAIHTAVQSSDMPAIVAYLLQVYPESLHSTVQRGDNLLMLAACHGRLDTTEYLLTQGIDPNQRLQSGLFALYLAIQFKHIATALCLIAHPAVNKDLCTATNSTALHLALELRLEGVAGALIQHGASMNIRRIDDGFDALCAAGASGVSGHLMALILDAKLSEKLEVEALLNARKRELEHLIKEDDDKAAELKKQQNPGGWVGVFATMAPLLQWSSGGGFFITPQSLIVAIMDIKTQPIPINPQERQSQLYEIERLLARSHHFPLTYYLEDATAVIHFAARRGHLDMVKALVKFEPGNITAKNSLGDTALMVAIKNGQKNVALFLAEITPTQMVNQADETASLCAIQYSQMAVFDRLMARGEDPFLRDKEGKNVLYHLLKIGDLARFVRSAEAAPQAVQQTFKLFPTDMTDVSSATIAAYYGHMLLVAYLRTQGVVPTSNQQKEGIPNTLRYALINDDLVFLQDMLLSHSDMILQALPICLQLAAENSSMRCLTALKPLASAEHWPIIAMAAVKSRNLDMIEQTLQQTENRNQGINPEGHTIAHYVVKHGLMSMIETLHQYGVDFTVAGTSDTTFSLAIAGDDYKCLKILLNLHVETLWPDNLLTLAIEKSSVRCQELLLKQYDKLSKPAGLLAVSAACKASDIDTLNDLLIRGRYSFAALEPVLISALGKKDELLKSLIKQGARPTESFFTAMITGDHIEAIRYFHQLGYSLNLEDYIPLTDKPYTQAALRNDYTQLDEDIASLLEAHENEDIDTVVELALRLPLHTLLFGDKKAPFLHLIFEQKSIDDGLMEMNERYDFKLIARLTEESMLVRLDPLLIDKQGRGLIQIVNAHNWVELESKLALLKTMLSASFQDQSMRVYQHRTQTQTHFIHELPATDACALVEQGISLIDDRGVPLLHHTVARESKSVVKQLLSQGQAIDSQRADGFTVLMLAAGNASLSFVRFLVEECGACPNQVDKWQETALCQAIIENKLENALYLMGITKALNGVMRNGKTPFMTAVIEGSMPLCEALIHHVTDFNHVDRKGYNALHYAALFGHTKIIQLLLDWGMDIHVETGIVCKLNRAHNSTPLYLAAQNGHSDAIRYLLRQGANYTLQGNGSTPLQAMACNKNPLLRDILSELPEYDDPDWQIKLFLEASRGDNVALLRELSIKIPMSVATKKGCDALLVAADFNAKASAAYLIQSGIYLECVNDAGNTPLHAAALLNATVILRMLMSRGINPNVQNKEGETALYMACEAGHMDAVLILLAMRANTQLASHLGLTPAQVALANQHPEIASLLFILGDRSLFEGSFYEIQVMKSLSHIAFLTKIGDALLGAYFEDKFELHLAVLLQHIPAIKFLCETDVTLLEKQNRLGQTPSAFAKANEFNAIATYLDYYQAPTRIGLLPESSPNHSPTALPRRMTEVEIITRLRKDEIRLSTPTMIFIDDFLLDMEASLTINPIAKKMSMLSTKTQVNFLNHYEQYIYKEKQTEFRETFDLFFSSMSVHSSTLLTTFDSHVFAPYSWREVLFNRVEQVQLFYQLIQHICLNKSVPLEAWFANYFEPIGPNHVTAETWGKALTEFNDFVTEVLSERYANHQALLSKPPQENISFRIQSDYLSRAIMALRFATNPEQIEWLDQLPQKAILVQMERPEDVDCWLRFPFVTKQMVFEDHLERMSIRDRNRIAHYRQFKAVTKACHVPELKTEPRDYATLTNLFEVLDRRGLKEPKKLLLAKFVLIFLAPGLFDKEALESLVTIAEKMNAEWGDDVFYRFFAEQPNVHVPLSAFVALVEKTSLLKKRGHLNLQGLMTILTVWPDWNAVSISIEHLYEEKIISGMPVESLAPLKAKFMSTPHPLAEAEIDELLIAYQMVVHRGVELRRLSVTSKEALKREIQLQGQRLADDPTNKEASNYLLAALRAMVLQVRHIYPYDTQMLTLLTTLNAPKTLKGRIPEVKTGEGKSTLVSMLAAFRASMGEYVDVVTSSGDLAERDQQTFAAFYEATGTTSSHLNVDHATQNDFRGRVIYATTYDFEASLLYELQNEDTARHYGGTSRPCEVVIVDEADNLFLDTALHTTRLLTSAPYDMRWVYPPIYAYVKKAAEERTPCYINEVTELLQDYQEGRHMPMFDKWSPFVRQWVQSAITAMKTVKDISYVVTTKTKHKKAEVTIIDFENTGREQTNMRWDEGIHEMIEIKEDLPPENEHLSATSMAHSQFYKAYKKIYGYTGTAGQDEERVEMREQFGVDVCDIPPHAPLLREEKPARYLLNVAARDAAILSSARAMIAEGRPVLIICKTIEETDRIAAMFDNNERNKLQVLNEKQKESEDFILWRAGMPGIITIATNAAGRGTDIILRKKSLDNGGLHVILTFFPSNTRVENQAMGRAGRQGQRGSAELIVSCDDAEIKKLMPEQAIREGLIHDEAAAILTIKKLRTDATTKLSQYRMEHSKKEAVLDEIVQRFFKVEMAALRHSVRAQDVDAVVIRCRSIQASMLTEGVENIDVPINQVTIGPYLRARSLLEAQTQGHWVDWKAFAESCREVFLEYLKQRWSLTYSKMNEYSTPIDAMQPQFNLFITTEIEPVKQNVPVEFERFVCKIVNHAAYVLAPRTPEVAPELPTECDDDETASRQSQASNNATEGADTGEETDDEALDDIESISQAFMLKHNIVIAEDVEEDDNGAEVVNHVWKRRDSGLQRVPGCYIVDESRVPQLKNNITFFKLLQKERFEVLVEATGLTVYLPTK